MLISSGIRGNCVIQGGVPFPKPGEQAIKPANHVSGLIAVDSALRRGRPIAAFF